MTKSALRDSLTAVVLAVALAALLYLAIAYVDGRLCGIAATGSQTCPGDEQ